MNRDLSDYEEYWTIPKKVLVKRLTEKMTISIVKDGVDGKQFGEPGHFHVVDNSGDVIKETITTYEKFIKKYDTLEIQEPLFDNASTNNCKIRKAPTDDDILSKYGPAVYESGLVPQFEYKQQSEFRHPFHWPMSSSHFMKILDKKTLQDYSLLIKPGKTEIINLETGEVTESG